VEGSVSVLQAGLYITVCTAKNRLRVRLQRLREPRYLLGAIVGAAYLYFTVFARRGSRASAVRRGARGAPAVPPQLAALASAGPALGALALLAVTALSWILPGNSGLLSFSEPEIQFLFPAPVPRRQLLIHRMLRSQIGLLFASAVVALMTPSVAGFTRLRVSIATWLLLVTAKVYYAGVTLARAKLASAHARARRVAWTPIAVLTAAVAIVAVSLARAFANAPASSMRDVLVTIRDVAAHGPASGVLWPFLVLVRPLFAEWPQPYLGSLAIAAGVLALTALWVLRSDQAFEDAAAAAVERRTEEEAAPVAARYRLRSGGWTLTAVGRPEGAFAWKAMLQTLRLVDRRTIARLFAMVFSFTVIAISLGRGRGLAATLGFFATIGAAGGILFAPQVLRIDMRQDLQHLELLKTWPVAPAAVVRGELIWPGVLITSCVWTLLVLALAGSGAVFNTLAWSWRLSAAASAAILAPALVFAQLAIHNGVALLFPAWVPLGSQRPRGLDALGQRLIMLGGTWLLLVIGILPAAVAGALVWFACQWFAGSAALVPGAAACAIVVAIEVALATEALGPAFERIDILAVERAE
jgi:ABC-2 type transport system permease protein